MTCEHCGKPITSLLQRLRKFCNPQCRQDAYNKARRVPPKPATRPMPDQRHCPFCGKVTEQQYCSTRCKFLSRHGLQGSGHTDIGAEEIERRFEASKAARKRLQARLAG